MAFGDTVQSGSIGSNTTGDASASCSAATAGNLLIAVVARNGVTATTGAWGTVTGWSLLWSSPANSGNMCGSIWGKIAAGGETSFATTMTNPAGNWVCQIHEFEGPFDPSFHDAAGGNENETNIASTTNTISTNTGGTTASASSLALAFFAVDSGVSFGTLSFNNSFTLVATATSGGRAGATLAKRVLSSTGTYSCTLSYSAGGASDEMYAALAIAKAAPSGDPPEVTLDTADAHEFNDDTPTLQFTGTDADNDDLEFQIQIADNTDFNTGTVLLDSYEGGGTGEPIHPAPLGSGQLDWRGEFQVDDRPMQSAHTNGGGIFDSIDFKIGNDQPFAISGETLGRIYAHSGSFGSTSAPANAAADTDTPTPDWEAQTDTVDWDDSEPMDQTWTKHDASGAERIQLLAAREVMVAADWLANTSSSNLNTVVFANDGGGTGGHDGNCYIDGDSSNHGVRATADLYFRLRAVQTVYVDAESTADAGFANQDNGGDTHPFTEGDQHAYTVQSSLDNGTYYWRVRAADGDGFGDWSEIRSFVVNYTPGGGGGGAVRRRFLAATR